MNKVTDIKPNDTIELPADLMQVLSVSHHGGRALRNRRRVFKVQGIMLSGCFSGMVVEFIASHDDTFKIVKRYAWYHWLRDWLASIPTRLLNNSISQLERQDLKAMNAKLSPSLKGPLT